MGQVHIEFTSDHQKVLQGLARSNEKLDQQVRKLRQVDRAGRGVGQSFQNAFAGISSTIAGMVGLHMAIGKVNQALQQQMELRRSVVGRIEHEEYALKRLIQISGGKPEVFKRYKEIAATLVEKPGMPHAEALDLVFKGVSLGFTDEQIKQMGQFKRFAGDVRPLLEGIAGLRAAFGKEAAGGTPESVMNAMLAAAEKSKVDVEMVAAEALTSAQAVKQLGGTAEESLAALAVATEGLKSAERAATAVGRFADVVGRDPRFRGKGLTAALVTMSQMTELQRKAVLGENIRAVRGAGVLLQNFDKYMATFEEIQRSISETGRPTSRTIMAEALGTRVTPAAELLTMQRAREAARLAEEKRYGPTELQRQTIRAQFERIMAEEDFGALRRAYYQSAMYFEELFRTEPSAMAERLGRHLAVLTHGGVTGGYETDRDLLQIFVDRLDEMNVLSRQQVKALEQIRDTGLHQQQRSEIPAIELTPMD